jgi:hypothetical protein
LSGISACVVNGLGTSLKRSHALFEMKDLPERDPDVENADATHSASHPTGRDDTLQGVTSGLPRRVEEKVIITPIAQYPQRTLRHPGQESEDQTDLKTEHNIKNDTELCGH